MKKYLLTTILLLIALSYQSFASDTQTCDDRVFAAYQQGLKEGEAKGREAAGVVWKCSYFGANGASRDKNAAIQEAISDCRAQRKGTLCLATGNMNCYEL